MSLQWFFRGCSLLLVVQTAVYWGYRMGARSALHQDECVDFRVETRLKQILTTNPTGRGDAPSPLKHGIVLTSQCSGSEWVVTKLNAIDGVEWQLERMIHYSDRYMDNDEWKNVSWSDYRRDLDLAFQPESALLADIEVANRHDDDDTVDTSEAPTKKDLSGKLISKQDQDPNRPPALMKGFKLMYDQLPQHLLPQFAQWLTDNQVYVIHLRRGCAVLQFASHMDKYMHAARNKIQLDHVYHEDDNSTTTTTQWKKPPKDWHLTLEDTKATSLRENRWLKTVKRLEANQEQFARYLLVHAARVPVFEVTYENLDGPFHQHWLRALVAFLGLPEPSETKNTRKKTIKTGARQCEERIHGLGGPKLTTLDGTRSQMECLRLRALGEPISQTKAATTFTVDNPMTTMGLPPMQGRCRLAPHCNQSQYGLYLEQQMLKIDPSFVPAIKGRNSTRFNATRFNATRFNTSRVNATTAGAEQ